MFNGTRLMIIELGNYNSAEELLIGTRPQGRRYMYAIRTGPECICTRAAVRMEVEGRGMRIGHRGAYKWVRVGNEHRDAADDCGAIKEALARNKIEID